ncbi:RND family efflux transporter MFP subunit [Bradyrhizobium sp. LM2.3]
MDRTEASSLSKCTISFRLDLARSPGFSLRYSLSPGCGQPTSQAGAPPPAPVTVAQPVKRTVTDWDEFTGRFEATEEVQVRPRVGGFVNSVEFQDGAIVHQGDLLYVIDPRPFEAVAEQADGQLSDARAKVELAKRELDRGLSLVQTSAVSEQVVDQRRQALQGAHAAVSQAEGALKAARLNIEFTHVTAPLTGRVGRHLVRPRQSRAGQRQRLVDAADLDRDARPDLRLFRHG